MLVAVLYRTRVVVEGGRDGHATAVGEGGLDVDLTTPTGLGGAGGAGTNPEQLLGAAYAASFLSAMTFVASQGGAVVPPKSTVSADVAIGPWSQGGFGLEIGLEVRLPGVSRTEAVSLLQRADRVCPFSNALHGSTSLRVTLGEEDTVPVLVIASAPRARDL